MVDLIVRLRELARSPVLAIAALIVANAIPIAGVLFLGWDALTLLVLYWLENGVVGLVNVLKIATAQGSLLAGSTALGATTNPFGSAASTIVKAVAIPFFIFHYGMFWAVHGVFVFLLPAIVGARAAFADGPTDTGRGLPILGEELGLPAVPAFDTTGLAIAAIVLLASHLLSFWINYLGRSEYRNVSPWAQMAQPYARVFVLHFVIVFGGVLIFAVGQPIALLLLLVVLKTGLDVVLHLRAHQKAQATPSVLS